MLSSDRTGIHPHSVASAPDHLRPAEPDRMFRAQTDTWVRMARTTACIVTLMALTSLALATAAVAPAAAPPWRAFAPSSPWNVPAAPESIAPNNPYADQFAGSPGSPMELSGTPDNPKYSSPIFFAAPGDPVASVDVGQPGWAPQRRDQVQRPADPRAGGRRRPRPARTAT